MITVHILEKNVSVIAFIQILPKILPAAYIFSYTIMTNLKNLIGNKSLNTKQCPAGLCPRIIPLNLYWKPLRSGRIPANSQKFIHFLHKKNPPYWIYIFFYQKWHSSPLKYQFSSSHSISFICRYSNWCCFTFLT